MSLPNFILISIGAVFLFLVLLNIVKAINTAKATAYSFVNKIRCAPSNWCPPKIDSTLEGPGPLGSPAIDRQAQRFCADLIGRITLKTTPYVVENPPGCEIIYLWSDDAQYPSFCLAWKLIGTNVCFVAVRGTMSLAEVIVDLDYGQKPLPQTDQALGILVHSGFTDLYERIRPELEQALPDKSLATVYVCGHSLGAGIATLCAIGLRQAGFIRVATYLFASPRVGNKALRNYIDVTLGMPVFRLENTCDVVPTLPLSVCPNFEEPTEPFMYEPVGAVETFQENRKSLQNNHLISAYIDFLVNKTINDEMSIK